MNTKEEMFEYYVVVDVKTDGYDEWTVYEGTDRAKALEAKENAHSHLTEKELKTREVECRVYCISGSMEDYDSDSIHDVISDLIGYDVI